MSAAGCEIVVDPAGNTIATRSGAEQSAAALGTGSHLDSVYSGGAFDGIAGVVAGVEIARLLAEARIETRHPLRFVAFAGEEGARFGQACMGSRLAAGLTAEEDLQNLRDKVWETNNTPPLENKPLTRHLVFALKKLHHYEEL